MNKFSSTVISCLPKWKYLNSDQNDASAKLTSTCKSSYAFTISNKLKADSIFITVVTGGIDDIDSKILIECYDDSITIEEKRKMLKISVEHWAALEANMHVQNFLRDYQSRVDEVTVGWTTFVRNAAPLKCTSEQFDVESFDGGALVHIRGDMPFAADETNLAAVAAVRECLEKSGTLYRADLASTTPQ